MRIFLQRFVLGKLLPSSSLRGIFIILFGIIIGFLIGICLNFENTSDSKKSSHFLDLEKDNSPNIKIEESLWIRCAILLQDSAENPEKYLLAITETFGRKCNETLFFTSSERLSKKFADSFNMLLLKFPLVTSSWNLFRKILNLIYEVKKERENLNIWTVVISEKNYLIVENLLMFLGKYSYRKKSVIIGKMEHITPFLSFLFPFTQKETFVIDAGIVFSEMALHLIIKDESTNCLANGWLIPRYTGKGLLKCVEKLDISIWDPIDEDGDHLLIPTNLRTHFSNLSIKKGSKNLITNNKLLTGCCSHRAIIFGYLSYRDIRLIHYVIDNLRVFV